MRKPASLLTLVVEIYCLSQVLTVLRYAYSVLAAATHRKILLLFPPSFVPSTFLAILPCGSKAAAQDSVKLNKPFLHLFLTAVQA